jgi:hypothetical protein
VPSGSVSPTQPALPETTAPPPGRAEPGDLTG